MIKKLLLLLVVNYVFCPANINADSLWVESNSGKSVYNSSRHYAVGDVITVDISAESTAVQEAGTTTRKRSDVGTSLYNLDDMYTLDNF